MDRSKVWKLVQTGWLFWGFMMPGVGDAVLGPTLLDLQLLIDESVDKFSYLILATGIGAVTGSLLAGLIFTTVNTKLKLAVTIMCGSLINAITPAVSSYTYFIFMFGLQGLCRGFIACYLLEVCNLLWEHKGTAFQFIYCGATTGSIMTPLIVRPFLCVPSTESTQPYWIHNHRTPEGGNDVKCVASDTHVQYAYVVLGLITMPAGFAFLYYWITTRKEQNVNREYENLSKPQVPSSTNIIESKYNYVYLAVLFCFYFPLLGNVMLYNTFLTAFGVDGPLNMPKNTMVYMTSLFWGGFLISRIGNTFLTPCCGNFKIILVNLICLIASGVVLITLASKYESALWISTISLGLFSGPFQGAALAWTEEFMKIDARVISISVLGVGTGAMALPFLGGLLYEHAPPIGHLYLVFAMILFLCIMFIVLNIIGRRMKGHSTLMGDAIKLENTDSSDS